jgi:hypothetical protein
MELKNRTVSREAEEEIKGNIARAASNEPSEKQVSFAKKLSEKYGEDLPESLLTDRKGISSWIDRVLKAHNDEEAEKGKDRPDSNFLVPKQAASWRVTLRKRRSRRLKTGFRAGRCFWTCTSGEAGTGSVKETERRKASAKGVASKSTC